MIALFPAVYMSDSVVLVLCPAHHRREYLATFKKTVAMHEVFLQRLAAHPILRNDHNYQVFLEFEGDVSIKKIHILSQMCT